MLVRIRFGKGSKVERKRRKNQRVAMAFATFLTPAAVMAAARAVSVAMGFPQHEPQPGGPSAPKDKFSTA